MIACSIQGLSQARAGVARAPCSASREVETGLSGEALTMFHDAQRNILELNKSRLMALDELKQAKERISELGVLRPQFRGKTHPPCMIEERASSYL